MDHWIKLNEIDNEQEIHRSEKSLNAVFYIITHKLRNNSQIGLFIIYFIQFYSMIHTMLRFWWKILVFSPRFTYHHGSICAKFIRNTNKIHNFIVFLVRLRFFFNHTVVWPKVGKMAPKCTLSIILKLSHLTSCCKQPELSVTMKKYQTPFTHLRKPIL